MNGARSPIQSVFVLLWLICCVSVTLSMPLVSSSSCGALCVHCMRSVSCCFCCSSIDSMAIRIFAS